MIAQIETRIRPNAGSTVARGKQCPDITRRGPIRHDRVIHARIHGLRIGLLSRYCLRESLNESRVSATAALRDGMRERRRREWLIPFARSLTKQAARKAAVPFGLRQNRTLTVLHSLAS